MKAKKAVSGGGPGTVAASERKHTVRANMFYLFLSHTKKNIPKNAFLFWFF